MKTDAETLKEVDEILSTLCPHGTTVEKARFAIRTVENAGKYIRATDSTVAAAILEAHPLPPDELARDS